MPIKKTKINRSSKSKELFKKRMNRSKTKKSNSKSNKKNNSKKSQSKNNSRFKKRKHKSNRKSNRKSNNNNHIGGFSSSNLVTVKEPGFNLDALGTAIGINIPSSRAAIYRSNSKTDSYQAMTP